MPGPRRPFRLTGPPTHDEGDDLTADPSAGPGSRPRRWLLEWFVVLVVAVVLTREACQIVERRGILLRGRAGRP